MTDPEIVQQAIIERLEQVIDPETGVDIIRMRLIEDLNVDEDGCVSYNFRPSSPFCPLAIPLAAQIQQAVAEVPGVQQQNFAIVGFALGEDLVEWLKKAMEETEKKQP